jgi:3-phenylpropionate/trans-cinnamate dioxygenase ferredoxin reductase subunit
LGVAVEGLEGRNGRLIGVRLAGGEILPCEMAIVGIGIVPAVEPLLLAGAEGGNGVAVDGQCRTSLADVFAVGDCALQTSRFTNGAALRIESVQNANDQATVVAKTIAGVPAVYDAVPWFWSNQYDLRLQTIGLSSGYDQTILRGDMAARSFSLVYLRGGEVIALDCVNAVKDYVQGRALVIARARVDPRDLASTAIPLKGLIDRR